MKSPLLAKEEEPQKRGCFVRAIVWLWRWLTPKSKECAETIVRLKRLMNQLDLASKNSLAQAEGKRQEIQKLLAGSASGEKRALARTMLQTAKRYETQAVQWASMREVAESLKIELVSQQQTLSVYNSFAQTNAAMERIAQTVNTASVESLMDSIQTQIDEGKSVSDIFGAVQMHGYDEEQLDDELTALLVPQPMQPSLAPQQQQQQEARVPDKEKEEKVVHKKNPVIG